MASSGIFGGRPAGNIDIVALFSSGASMFNNSQFSGYIKFGGQVASNWNSFTAGGRLNIPTSMLSSLNMDGTDLNFDIRQFQLFSAAALRYGPQNTVWNMQPDGMLFFRSASRFSPVYWGGFVGGGRPGASVLAKYEGAMAGAFTRPGAMAYLPNGGRPDFLLVADTDGQTPSANVVVISETEAQASRRTSMLAQSDAYLKDLDTQRAYIEQETAYFQQLLKHTTKLHSTLEGVAKNAPKDSAIGALSQLILQTQEAVRGIKMDLYQMKQDHATVRQRIHDELVRRDTMYAKIVGETKSEMAIRQETVMQNWRAAQGASTPSSPTM